MYIWRVRLSDPIAVMACAAAMSGVSAATWAQTPGYHLLGLPPGATSGSVGVLSPDGRVAAGTTFNGSNAVFTWTESGGRYDILSADLQMGNVVPRGISDDGSTLTGTQGGSRAIRWSGPGTFQNLGTFSNFQFTAGNGLSGDGSIVVGRAWTNQPNVGQAWRWTQGTGYQGLGYTFPEHVYSEANAISRDGNVIVGMSQSSGGRTDAFRWTAAGGMQALPPLPISNATFAYGTNHDGSIIVGAGGGVGVLWDSQGAHALTSPLGWSTRATNTSDDGSVVLGLLFNSSSIPAVWTPAAGWQTSAAYFADRGFPLPQGWEISTVTSLSSDGRTFGGSLLLPGDTFSRAFVLTVPAPTSVCALLLVGSAARPRRRRFDTSEAAQ